MTEEILTTLEDLGDIQLESELMTLDKLGIQLVKEYYMEEADIFQEGGGSKNNRRHETIQDDGHVPTIHRIIDWFARIINRIRSHFLSAHADRLARRIRNLDNYKKNDVFEGIMVDYKWYKENVSDVIGLNDIGKHHSNGSGINFGQPRLSAGGNVHTSHMGGPKDDTLMFYMIIFVPNNSVASANGIDASTAVFDQRNDFVKIARNIGKLREKLQDSYDEIRHLNSVNNHGPLKHRHDIGKDSDVDIELAKARGDNGNYVDHNNAGEILKMKAEHAKRGDARNVDVFLDSIIVTNQAIKESLELIRKGIPEMRQQAHNLATQNLNRSQDVQRRQEAYVHAMTDLGRAFMYVTQIQVIILQWMRWTLGPDHNPASLKEV